MYLYGHSMGGLVAVASVLRQMTQPVLVDFLHRYTEITHDPLLFSVAQGIF
jgi:alpha-beta hydrolase superfamily lysophospholipase